MSYLTSTIPVAIIALAILLRWLVAQFPHSGQGHPPMYGDYEAQRHWMEITTNLPVVDWYSNTTDNDLLYWGLDYPPLSAYHMFVLGHISRKVNVSWTQLHESRGTETADHKLFMRLTVLVTDVLIYMTALIYFFYKTQPIFHAPPPTDHHRFNIAIYTAMALIYPAQILIDHGHFQYNCFFLGLFIWSVICMVKGKIAIASILFSSALCYKQMSLYYSLPFFYYIVSVNLRRRPIYEILKNIISTGIIVICTMIVIFSPYIWNPKHLNQVLIRIFPFNRGIFEDKVANFWFSVNVLYKLRQFYTQTELLRASTVLTILASLPAGINLLFKPSTASFKYGLVNTSLAFFLFSFQVHEKTILVPGIAILLLYREHPMAVNLFNIVSTFSLQPLLFKDSQAIPYLVLMVSYTLLTMEIFRRHITMSLNKLVCWQNFKVLAYLSSIIGCFALNIMAMTYKPPPRYPDLHQVLNAIYSCLHFIAFMMFFYFRQFTVGQKLIKPNDTIYLIKKTD